MKPGSPRWWQELGLEAPPGTGPGGPAAAREPLPATPDAPAVAPAPGRETALVPRSAPAAGREPAPRAAAPAAVALDAERAARIAQLAWEDLPADIDACSACALRKARKRSVPGVGVRGARWLFVGEGPGAEEDQRGEPFVGAAGQLLDSMLDALGLHRARDAYIANVVKCRPPGNRTPEPGECAQCMPYLQRQIALLAPGMIVALGRVAAQALLATDTNVGSLRGKVHRYQGIPLVVTYHPAYLLRSLGEKGKAWSDLCLAQRTLSPPA